MQRTGNFPPDDYEQATGPHLDIVALAALIFALFLGANLLFDRDVSGDPIQKSSQPAALPITDPAAFVAPYDKYTITQGPHGASYGHMAIDIAAGKGATIKSPINGEVSRLYTDQYGNPRLVIENKFYKVTLMHGVYDVASGDRVKVGQPIGKESNQGYTTDMQGRSCKQRNCGFHTHLNVFDKRVSKNINPLPLLKDSSK